MVGGTPSPSHNNTSTGPRFQYAIQVGSQDEGTWGAPPTSWGFKSEQGKGVLQGTLSSRDRMGYPLPSPSPRQNSKGALATRRAVCLFRSRRRSSLFFFFFVFIFIRCEWTVRCDRFFTLFASVSYLWTICLYGKDSINVMITPTNTRKVQN